MKLQLLLLAIILTVTTGCNTRYKSTAFIKKGDEWVCTNQLISKKSKDIEKEVLLKVEEIQYENSNNITDLFCRQTLQWESYALIDLTSSALGRDTLEFLKRFKLNNELKNVKLRIVPIIKKRLQLIDLVKDYQPKNELEAKIIERIREYPGSASERWPTEQGIDYNYYNGGSFHNFKLHEYKIGPLVEGKYIYVKIFEENGSVEYVGVSDKEKGRTKTIFVYAIDYKYPPAHKNAEK